MQGEGGARGTPPNRTATTLLEDRRGRTMRFYCAGRKRQPDSTGQQTGSTRAPIPWRSRVFRGPEPDSAHLGLEFGMLVLTEGLCRLAERAPVMPGHATRDLGVAQIERLRTILAAARNLLWRHPDRRPQQARRPADRLKSHCTLGSQRIQAGARSFTMFLQPVRRIDPRKPDQGGSALRKLNPEGIAVDDFAEHCNVAEGAQ